MVPVEPQVFDVLSYLVARRERVVAKTELLDNIWGDRFVSESALTSRIKSARQAVGDDGRTQRTIRTVHGRGYQFVGQVLDPPIGEASSREVAHRPTPAPSLGPTDRPELDRLVSREAELEAVMAQLAAGRLVTLVGPGGVGKTRLASEVSRIWEDSGERSAFVPLEDVTDPDLVLPTIGGALGLRSETEVDAFALLSEALRAEPALLVLDNVEHLSSASGDIGRLVATLPELRVLVTSRDRLRLSVERTIEVEPLATDGGDEVDPPAATLFEQFARQADPSFRLTDENRSTVSTISELVDGLPLALALAAAQLRYLSLDYLVSHLRANTASITDSLHDRPERQHSVERLVEWSYQLLTPSQQLLLARLSVFAGGWPLAGATAVGHFGDDGEALSGLASLVDKSLVRSQPADGAPRFSMLNIIDAFATARLEEGDQQGQAVDDHGAWVAGLVRSIEEERWGDRAGTWLDDVEVEHANIVTALQRAEDLDRPDRVCRIVGDLHMWWYRTGRHVEGRRWIERALAGLDRMGDEAGPEVQGRLHLVAGFIAFTDRDIDRARGHYRQAIDAAERADDWRYQQQALANLSATSIRRPDEAEQALHRLDGVIDQARARNEQVVLAHALNVSGVLLRFAGQPEQARERYEAARAANRQTGDRYQEAMNLGNLAHLAGSIDRIDEALSSARSGLHLTWRIGSQVMCAWTIGLIAGLLQREGSAETATRLMGASAAVLHSLGAHSGTVADQSSPDETRSALRDQLGAERFETLEAEGRELKLEAAVELALDPGA